MKPKLSPRLADHPTVRAVRTRVDAQVPDVIDADWLRQLCLDAGADDVAFASADDPALTSEREHVESALPGVRSYISLVVKMNRDNVRSSARSVANQEFHRSGEIINEAAHRITRALEEIGHRAVNPSATFPMEMDRYPGRIWVVAHKPVAVASGLGVMGIHRNVIHPRFGNFILLATILVGTPISSYGQPLDYSPCLECKLCVAACPVGAIGKNGEFDFLACSVHNYREFMGGFTDWVQTIADSADAADFRSRVSDSENASMWQSLSFKANYKAAYCLAVCPAGRTSSSPTSTTARSSWTGCSNPCRTKGNAVRATRLGGQGACRKAVSAQDREGGRQRHPGRVTGRWNHRECNARPVLPRPLTWRDDGDTARGLPAVGIW